MNHQYSGRESQSMWKRRLKENLLLFSLFLNPSKRRASVLYDLISTENTIGDKQLYLNFGYWKASPKTLDEAGDALVTLLGETAKLSSEDRVLDVGFGFGDQDIVLMDRFSPRQIVGLNVTRLQVDVARRRVAERNLSDRIDLRFGSATEIPFEGQSFDKVLALECALHFYTRESFFHEAFRVLKPGGRLAMADIIPIPQSGRPTLKGWLNAYMGRAFWQICKENVYDHEVYREKMISAGFKNVEVTSIREHVMEPFSRYILERMSEPEMIRRIHPPLRRMFMDLARATLEQPADFAGLDYVLAIGDKPSH